MAKIARFGIDFIFYNKCTVVINFLINQFSHIFFLSSLHIYDSILLYQRIRNQVVRNLQICSTSYSSSLPQNCLFKIYTRYLSYERICYKSICTISSLSYSKVYGARNPSEINLHDFIIIIHYFFEVYEAKCRFDTKSPGKVNCLILISSHNHFLLLDLFTDPNLHQVSFLHPQVSKNLKLNDIPI